MEFEKFPKSFMSHFGDTVYFHPGFSHFHVLISLYCK